MHRYIRLPTDTYAYLLPSIMHEPTSHTWGHVFSHTLKNFSIAVHCTVERHRYWFSQPPPSPLSIWFCREKLTICIAWISLKKKKTGLISFLVWLGVYLKACSPPPQWMQVINVYTIPQTAAYAYRQSWRCDLCCRSSTPLHVGLRFQWVSYWVKRYLIKAGGPAILG